MLAVHLVASAPAAADPAAVAVTRVKPAAVADADFARHRDRRLWRGMRVERVVFREGPILWRLWRITRRGKRNGPMWVVPHDDENAAFAAGLVSVRKWGGTLVAVDTGPDDASGAARYNRDTADGRRIDPNRAFTHDAPVYLREILTGLRRGQPIIALHTNPRGFAARLTACDTGAPGDGQGEISVRLCNKIYHPRSSRQQRWPFDDEDTLALAPVPADQPGAPTWCRAAMRTADFNMVEERVGVSDGSLSNYAVQRGLSYVNFETRERGSDPAGLADARDRLVAMINRAMKRCAKRIGVTRRSPSRKTPR